MTSKATITVPSHVKIDIFHPLRLEKFIHIYYTRFEFEHLKCFKSVIRLGFEALKKKSFATRDSKDSRENSDFFLRIAIFISHDISCELLLAYFFILPQKQRWRFLYGSYHMLLVELLCEFLNKLLLEGLYQITEINTGSFCYSFYGKLFRPC